jgi:hypothetical protein
LEDSLSVSTFDCNTFAEIGRTSCQECGFLLLVEESLAAGAGGVIAVERTSPMTDIPRPTTYAGKLALVQRLARSAQYRTDPKLAVRELCEAMNELTTALLEREPAADEGTQVKKPLE